MEPWKHDIINQLIEEIDADYKTKDGTYKYPEEARWVAMLEQLLDEQDRPRQFEIEERDGGYIAVWKGPA